MAQENQMEQLLQAQENEIKKLKVEKETLRQQAKDARKKVRELERKIQLIERSRWLRLGNFIKKVLANIMRVIKLPYRAFKKVYGLLFVKANEEVVSTITLEKSNQNESAAEVMENQETRQIQEQISDPTPEVKRELSYPEVSNMDCKNLFDIDGKVTTVSVVVCIHNALYDVEECLLSLWQNRTFPYEIILVDDGSDEETRDYVAKFAEITGVKLLRNDVASGYTKAANKGLHASESDYVILLNSDTIVTAGWVEKMITCFRKNEKAGIVSPLSNAASYQSVPEIHDSVTGDWKINTLEDGITLEMMGQIVEMTSEHVYPQVPVLNGFCFMISRQVINTIGYLDEESFPRGYGEEVDYCLRAGKAGFELRIVDDTYIFHEKSKSFSHKTRKELGQESKGKLKEKHGEMYRGLDAEMEACTELEMLRKRILEKQKAILDMPILKKKIAFLLTARGGSGGANSVCQEVMGMRKLGVDAYVLNSSNYKDEFESNYPELMPYVRYFNKKSEKSLLEASAQFDIIIGTIFTTVKSLKKISERYPDKKFGYYIQDYEPMFFDESEDYWQEARDSYTLLEDICMFAKTKWIANTVEKEHGRKVNIVEPSIDIAMYNPYVIEEKIISMPIKITAMIRPKTERRNPIGTMQVLKMLKEKYGEKVQVNLFGCGTDEIIALGDVAEFNYANHGVLKRWEVADLLAQSHIFLDMSTYQAFGRTGLESMCLGCIAIIPEEGGADKYAIDGENAIVVDTLDVNLVYKRICELIEAPEKMKVIQKKGLQASQGYSITKASMSEMKVLNSYCI